ncbi:transcriptional regulator [Phragmitibacter flavus]|uniref:Transcriptional regulator n=1 Tax=Phragmitibacter flavus TaxID=2576071 RepID=A0A5R8KDN9_9BACT|nr:P-II family nitrogen regulator [Phragmitibacter flavus]TLD69699.1 transcriptional regulator [Phragmitibacter flavus]
MKLVTIVCEAILEERVVELLREAGAHGHTAFPVHGSGGQGERHADISETANVQLQVIVKPAVAETVLARLQGELFQQYAMVAYESDVRVLRPDKF